jgi:hypothetical protein
MTTMSRRKALRLTAATTAAGLTAAPAVLASGIAEPDPIFAAIERHRVANAAEPAAIQARDDAIERFEADTGSKLDRQTKLYGETVKPLEVKADEAWLRVADALRALARTVPTTAAGLAAMLAYERESREPFWELFDGDDLVASRLSIEKAACRLAGLPAPDVPVSLEEEETA